MQLYQTLDKFNLPILKKRVFLIITGSSSIMCLLMTYLHYKKILPGNPYTWIAWVSSILFLFIYSFEYENSRLYNKKLLSRLFLNRRFLLYLLLTILFFVSHLWNFSNLPWSDKGLFDDGAWDIYFSKKYIFTEQPFQAAFFDEVGRISREVIFHYFITIIFKIFGYNLLVFNLGLTFLGYITFIFTTLLCEKLFNNLYVTITAAVIFNFLPIHFMHTYAGHRYAMASPMIMTSLYFIYTGFKNKRKFRLALGGLFAAFAVDSAVMGKQYLYGLAFGALLIFIFKWKELRKTNNKEYLIFFVLALLTCMMPLLVYVSCNNVYFGHESNMTNKFLMSLNIDKESEGLMVYLRLPFAFLKGLLERKSTSLEFQQYVNLFTDTFFTLNKGVKWFIPGFLPLPLSYYFLFIPGIIIAMVRKRFEIVLLSLIPIAGSFVAGSSDYRVLHGVPFWILLMSFTLSFVADLIQKYNNNRKNKIHYTAKIILVILVTLPILSGLVQSFGYINNIMSNPNSLRLLPHRDVEIARYMQDIGIGIENPSSKMKWDELSRDLPASENYDTLLCQKGGYAITHAFLYDFNDMKVLSFSNQLPFNIMEKEEILQANKTAIKGYDSSAGKDLKLIWEYDQKTDSIISSFQRFEKYGMGEELVIRTDNGDFRFYVLNIKNLDIEEFKKNVAQITTQ